MPAPPPRIISGTPLRHRATRVPYTRIRIYLFLQGWRSIAQKADPLLIRSRPSHEGIGVINIHQTINATSAQPVEQTGM